MGNLTQPCHFLHFNVEIEWFREENFKKIEIQIWGDIYKNDVRSMLQNTNYPLNISSLTNFL